MINVALKEWSVVCDLLAEGSLAFLLRKGGIHEDHGPGVFRLEHPRFAFFPSWAHQKPHMIKPALRDRVQVLEEPAEVTLSLIGEAVKIWQVPHRAAFEQLDDLHPWSEPYVDMRFNYKPDHPLYLVAVRCARLAQPKSVINDWTYGGCKSWVPLKEQDAIDPANAAPAITDDQFNALRDRIDKALTI